MVKAVFNLTGGGDLFALGLTSEPVNQPQYLIGVPYSLPGSLTGLSVGPFLISSVGVDEFGATSPGAANYYVNNYTYRLRTANRYTGFFFHTMNLDLYANQNNDAYIYSATMRIKNGPTAITGTNHGFAMRHVLDNGSSITGDLKFFEIAYTDIKGTVGGSIYDFFANYQSNDTTTSVTNAIAYHAEWDLSGVVACTGYSAVLSANINSNTRDIDVYGSRITWSAASAMAGVRTWRGYYLLANNVTCGATRFFYGLDIDMSTMTVGGTVYGIYVRTPAGTPAMMAGNDTITTTTDYASWLPTITARRKHAPSGASFYQNGQFIFETNPTASADHWCDGLFSAAHKEGNFNNTGGMTAMNVHCANYGAGTVTYLYGIRAYARSGAGSGTVGTMAAGHFKIYYSAGVTNGYGVYLESPQWGGAGLFGSVVGLLIGDFTSAQATNACQLALVQAGTIPTNRWAIYSDRNWNNMFNGPTIIRSMSKEDDFDSTMTWSVGAAAPGVKWRLTLAGAGAIAQTANARGGIVSITSTIATPSWMDEFANVGWSVQDYPVLYCRFRTLETVNTMKVVGFTDTVNGAGNLPYTTNALLITVDTSIGNFFYLTGVVGGARVNVSTTVALDANYHTFMLLPGYDSGGSYSGYELWVDGAYKCSIPAANVPVGATMMQALPAYAGNLGGAVMSTIFVDTVKFSQRRNTGTAA